MDCALLLQQVLVVSCTIGFFWKLTKHMWSFLNVEKDPVVVLLTEATGPLCHAIVPMIARGAMFGPDQPVTLHLLDVKATTGALECIKAELIDTAFPLLRGVVATMDTMEACQGVDVAVMIGEFLQSEGTERKEFLSKNVKNYKVLAMALEENAAEDCKILVVADPANTVALILKHYAPSIAAKNVTYLTRTDHNQALGRISESLGTCVGDVRNVVVWGNRSFVDTTHATITSGGGEQRVKELVSDDKWLKTGTATARQPLGEAVTKTRKLPGALSTASAACDHMRDWILGTPKGTWVSMGVCSDGSYGIQPGTIYSFPVTCQKGQWSIVQGLKIDELTRTKMDKTAKELNEEKSLAYSCLH